MRSALALILLLAIPAQAQPYPAAEAQTLALAQETIALRSVQGPGNETGEVARVFARALRRLGTDDEAAEAEIAAVRATAFEPEMIAIAGAMRAGDLPQAEALLRRRLAAEPLDVAAIRLMA